MGTIKVNKSDFKIERSLSGVYSIEGYINNELKTIWGGDSAFEDHYSEDIVKDIYENWDGTLEKIDNWIGHENEYCINI